MKAIEKIFSLMTERGISAAQLTKDAYLTVGSITQWKKGTAKPSAENLSKLADYFGVSVDYLLGRTEIRETVTAENQFKIKKAPSLTDEEKQLLNDYRALSDETKILLHGLIINLKKGDAERKKTTKKQDNIF